MKRRSGDDDNGREEKERGSSKVERRKALSVL